MLIFQEIDVQSKKAIVIFVPVPQLRAYQKVQTRLVRELEKKFSGKHVVFIAQVLDSYLLFKSLMYYTFYHASALLGMVRLFRCSIISTSRCFHQMVVQRFKGV